MVTVLIRKYRSCLSCPSLTACSGLRFVDEMRRKSTGIDLAPPSRGQYEARGVEFLIKKKNKKRSPKKKKKK